MKKLNGIAFLLAFLITACAATAFFISYQTEGSLMTYRGFAVDQAGRLYLGKDLGKVYVYQNSEKVQTIEFPTSGNYAFIITDDNELALLRGYTLSYYSISDDKNGSIVWNRTLSVEESPYQSSTSFYRTYEKRKDCEGADGHRYQLTSSMLYTTFSNETGIVLQLRNNRLISLAFCLIGLILLTVFIILVFQKKISMHKDSLITMACRRVLRGQDKKRRV